LIPLAASDRRQPGPAIAEQAAPAAASRNEIRAVCDVEDKAAAPAAAAVDLRQLTLAACDNNQYGPGGQGNVTPASAPRPPGEKKGLAPPAPP
jgi:hypothetical protein